MLMIFFFSPRETHHMFDRQRGHSLDFRIRQAKFDARTLRVLVAIRAIRNRIWGSTNCQEAKTLLKEATPAVMNDDMSKRRLVDSPDLCHRIRQMQSIINLDIWMVKLQHPMWLQTTTSMLMFCP